MIEKNENSTRLEGQLLYSEHFDDFYSSRFRPDEEKTYVFCAGNHLESRFPSAETFTIAELGFGSGLGFLTTAHLWQQLAATKARLHFISIEKFPLEKEKLSGFLQQFPQLQTISNQLLDCWPIPTPGFHHIDLPGTTITLTLIFAEVLDSLRQLEANVDAWFLDGFSPAKNPAMWRPAVLREIARLSYRETTIATYTAAGQVRRDLTKAGFVMSKAPGFGQKRERLIGHFRPDRIQSCSRIHRQFRPVNTQPETREITIIGAGLAGCACANRLAARGYQVTLLEAHDKLAAGTSENPAAIMQPFLSLDDNVASRFSRQGYWYTLYRVRQLAAKGIDSGFHQTGLFSLPKDKPEQRRKASIAANPDFPTAYLRWQSSTEFGDGILYPSTGWFNLGTLCRALVKEFDSQINVKTEHAVDALEFHGACWNISTSQGTLKSPHVIIATGHGSRQFPQLSNLPLRTNRGQITTATSVAPPSMAAIKQGYIVPIDDKTVCFGSTYEMDTLETSVKVTNDAHNLDAIRTLSTSLHKAIDPTSLQGWSGIRATTSDHLPLVGEVPQPDAFTAIYGPFLLGKKPGHSPEMPFYPGLYCCTGLGSRAMTSGILAGELIASLVNAEPLPVERAVYEALHPARFPSRQIIQAAHDAK